MHDVQGQVRIQGERREQVQAVQLQGLRLGHSARGYTSIGIGEEQRPELAALTMPERMSLAVLKVPPPHSSPDRRAASTSSALATLLITASSPLTRSV